MCSLCCNCWFWKKAKTKTGLSLLLPHLPLLLGHRETAGKSAVEGEVECGNDRLNFSGQLKGSISCFTYSIEALHKIIFEEKVMVP